MAYDATAVVTLKFVEGSHVRQRDTKFVIDPEEMLDEDPGLLCCYGLSVCAAEREVSDVSDLLDTNRVPFRASFPGSEEELAAARQNARNASGEFEGDLRLFYRLDVSSDDVVEFVNRLRSFAIVDTAYIEPSMSISGGNGYL